MTDIDDILTKANAGRKEHLIQILLCIQSKFGYISQEHAITTAKHLNVSLTKVYSTATFYNFSFQKNKIKSIEICNGFTCHIHGSIRLKDEIDTYIQLKQNKIEGKEKFLCEETSCKGLCHHSPVVKTETNLITDATLEKVISEIT